MPGGFGTLDELSEVLTLVQTKRMSQIPIVFFGSEFYKPLLDFYEKMLEMKYISPEDKNLYLVTDDVEEAVDYIFQNAPISEILKNK
jgi:predicted Rossmann-fold nucleotide-binding protein